MLQVREPGRHLPVRCDKAAGAQTCRPRPGPHGELEHCQHRVRLRRQQDPEPPVIRHPLDAQEQRRIDCGQRHDDPKLPGRFVT